MTHYKFRIEGIARDGYDTSAPVIKVYVAENLRQAGILAQMDNIILGIGGRITNTGRTTEPLDRRVRDRKKVNRLRTALAV